MKGDKKHGFGILKDENGDCFEGEFFDDLIEGYGILTCADGLIYKGFWKNNK